MNSLFTKSSVWLHSDAIAIEEVKFIAPHSDAVTIYELRLIVFSSDAIAT